MQYRADLHIHSVLSPCGDLEMSPVNIIAEAKKKKLDIIGITDHNSTLHGPLMKRLGAEQGVFVLMGVEITTREEVHCLAFFETEEQRLKFQQVLDRNMSDFPNDPDKFGYQVVVDEQDNIVQQIQPLLIAATQLSVDDCQQLVHELGGLFIPAHVDRAKYSMSSQLGFIPPDLKYDALELSTYSNPEKFLEQHSYLKNVVFIQSSDAHFIGDIGKAYSLFELKEKSFGCIRMALKNVDGNKVLHPHIPNQ